MHKTIFSRSRNKIEMKAQIKESAIGYFQPFFITHVDGQQVQLTMGEVTNNWPKYVNTSVGQTLYKNVKKLKEFSKKIQGPVKPIVLDMSKAVRGTSFSKESKSKNKASDIKAYQARQEKARARLAARNKRAKDAITAHKAKLTKEANKAKQNQKDGSSKSESK